MTDKTDVAGKKHRSQILEAARIKRVFFDPKKKVHRDSLKRFIVLGTWGDVAFLPEHPYVDVPSTCLTKLARHYLKIE